MKKFIKCIAGAAAGVTLLSGFSAFAEETPENLPVTDSSSPWYSILEETAKCSHPIFRPAHNYKNLSDEEFSALSFKEKGSSIENIIRFLELSQDDVKKMLQACKNNNAYINWDELFSRSPKIPYTPPDPPVDTGCPPIYVGDLVHHYSNQSICSMDALEILKRAVGLENGKISYEDIQVSDIDENGIINSNDALQILKYVVGIKDEENSTIGKPSFLSAVDRNRPYEKIWIPSKTKISSNG